MASAVVKDYRNEAGPVPVLRGVDLEIPAGQFVAVTGPSGSGKTTLVNCLSGLDDIDRGSIHVDGQDLATLGDKRRSDLRSRTMGFVFQSFNLVPVLSACENVALPLLLTGAGRRDAVRRAAAALDDVGLSGLEDRLPGRLSGGQQQRVAIARALVGAPRVVFADEPTGNLDHDTGEEVFALLESVHARGVTVVLVTHERDLAGRADRRIVMQDGRITLDELRPVTSS